MEPSEPIRLLPLLPGSLVSEPRFSPQNLIQDILTEVLPSLRTLLDRGLPLDRAVAGLLSSDRRLLEERIGGCLRELLSLASETDSQNFFSQLLGLGRRSEERHPEVAALLYHFLGSQEMGDVPVAFLHQARFRFDRLSGGGSAWEQITRGIERVAIDSVDMPSLIAMGGGSLAFNAGRILTARLAARFLSGTAIRIAAGFGGYLAEFPSFALLSRSLNAAVGREVEWSMPAVRRDLGSAALTLGPLRLFGAGAGRLSHRIGFARESLGERIFSCTGMFAGIMAGHEAEVQAGWREREDFTGTLLAGVTTFAQFHIAGHAMRRLFVPTAYASWDAELNRLAEVSVRPVVGDLPTLPFSLDGGTLARSRWREYFRDILLFPLWMMMGVPGGGRSGHGGRIRTRNPRPNTIADRILELGIRAKQGWSAELQEEATTLMAGRSIATSREVVSLLHSRIREDDNRIAHGAIGALGLALPHLHPNLRAEVTLTLLQAMDSVNLYRWSRASDGLGNAFGSMEPSAQAEYLQRLADKLSSGYRDHRNRARFDFEFVSPHLNAEARQEHFISTAMDEIHNHLRSDRPEFALHIVEQFELLGVDTVELLGSYRALRLVPELLRGGATPIGEYQFGKDFMSRLFSRPDAPSILQVAQELVGQGRGVSHLPEFFPFLRPEEMENLSAHLILRMQGRRSEFRVECARLLGELIPQLEAEAQTEAMNALALRLLEPDSRIVEETWEEIENLEPRLTERAQREALMTALNPVFQNWARSLLPNGEIPVERLSEATSPAALRLAFLEQTLVVAGLRRLSVPVLAPLLRSLTIDQLQSLANRRPDLRLEPLLQLHESGIDLSWMEPELWHDYLRLKPAWRSQLAKARGMFAEGDTMREWLRWMEALPPD